MWKVIREHFPMELKDAVRGMRMCKDNKVSGELRFNVHCVIVLVVCMTMSDKMWTSL